MKYLFASISVIVLFVLAACDGGLEPPDPSAGLQTAYLKGTIRFVGGSEAWPSPAANPEQDSVYEVRLVAFKVFPPEDIIYEILSGNAYVTDALDRFVDTINFSIEIEEVPQELQYIAVAQQFDSSLFSDWRVIGVFTESGDKTDHTKLNVDEKKIYNLDIEVDWDDLPPQPFD